MQTHTLLSVCVCKTAASEAEQAMCSSTPRHDSKGFNTQSTSTNIDSDTEDVFDSLVLFDDFMHHSFFSAALVARMFIFLFGLLQELFISSCVHCVNFTKYLQTKLMSIAVLKNKFVETRLSFMMTPRCLILDGVCIIYQRLSDFSKGAILRLTSRRYLLFHSFQDTGKLGRHSYHAEITSVCCN